MNHKKTAEILGLLALSLLIGCVNNGFSQVNETADNIVRRSYPYVAMYNMINKSAMQESPFKTGWNGTFAMKGLADHTVKMIARPNNDTLYVSSSLDLRNDAVVIHYPAFDSKFVCLETSAYDHYCGVPLTTTRGDFKKPTKILFYTARTKGYSGQPGDRPNYRNVRRLCLRLLARNASCCGTRTHEDQSGGHARGEGPDARGIPRQTSESR